MQEFLTVTGMILKAVPIGEYDRRVVILTKEKGKISAFVKGARRQNSRFLAPTNPFSFGEFKLYVGKTSYNVTDIVISNYFEGLRDDFEGAYYGMYFLEVMDYFTRENNDEKEMLKLLYQSLKALQSEKLSKKLVRYIFEIKAVALNGEFPGIPENKQWKEATAYAIQFIVNSGIEKLYTFLVTEEVLNEMRLIANEYRARFMEKQFKSLEIIDTL